jgi:hypothetical protein
MKEWWSNRRSSTVRTAANEDTVLRTRETGISFISDAYPGEFSSLLIGGDKIDSFTDELVLLWRPANILKQQVSFLLIVVERSSNRG